MRIIDFIQADAFAERPFGGNPAGVCLLDAPLEDATMQAIAAEMNLSETAFLMPRTGTTAEYDLRWFTPMVEVDLCGHATLASAHVLWSEKLVGREQPLGFHTKSGRLIARAEGERIVLDFPALPPVQCETPAGLVEALGARVLWTGHGGDDLLAVLDDEATVRGLAPDFGRLIALPVRGVIATAEGKGGESGPDFVSRFFAPAVGIDEDPVTGSAHCALGPFWARRLGRRELRAWQASPRGGALTVRVGEDRVEIGGGAVTVLRGRLFLP